MTKALTIIALFFSTLLYGQVAKEAAYKNIDGLTVADSIAWKDIVGGFYISDGFGGYNFRLDSNMTFRKIDFSCMARFTVDSGSWTIRNNNTVVLKSNKQTLYFDIVKFDNFYFFILPTQRQKFVADLQSTRVKFKNAKPFTIDDKTYSVNYMIGYSLVEKYFAKEIEDITGT
ncbi:hypothetical protein [Lacibacter sp.]|uniref:hypothetical protein n=1 Tax=Lacibacter sp. TaxID=1915409 RepID=UPI002B4B3212|nr:hypothetical protein [Lacibacter sp.]HLP35639.1 hypothetical protein [Lacibacter sp.]